MKIKSYKKKKSNLYEITFQNGEKVNIYDDVILKNNLLLKEDIQENDLKKIITENSYLESYYLALKYLETKLRTEKEIRTKLKNYDKKIVDYTIERLKKEGYLKEDIYIKAYVNDAINLKTLGPLKIINDLKKLGFKEEIILNYLNTISKDTWDSKIEKYIEKKIKTNHKLSALILKQKIVEDLIKKGYYKENILEVLDNFTINDDEDIYEREYQKLKNKLSKKYNGDKLEYYIRVSLNKKGFRK